MLYMSKNSFIKLLFYWLLVSQNVFSQNNEIILKTKENWFNLDPKVDNINGVSTELAYKNLLKNKESKTVVVAIIDSGIEIDHDELKGKIWQNEKEIAGNGLDDDNNGYVDDINGWDFLGNSNGKDLEFESLELTREYVKYGKLVDKIDTLAASNNEKKILERFKLLKEKYEKKLAEIEEQGGSYYLEIHDTYMQAKLDLMSEFKVDKITDDLLKKVTENSSEKLQNAKKVYLLLAELGLTQEQLVAAYNYFNSLINYGVNLEYAGRETIIGDKIGQLTEVGYGNNEVEGPDAHHGTHVAGIIAANRNDNSGISGIAENVKIMALRAVPDGDERDKDVANAIRYAVNNGAKIINMSFGKAFSPEKEYVEEAIKYAESKNVLMVHAAGNEGEDLEITENFPNKFYNNGGACNTWITVGALSWKKGEDMVAEFSNYGAKSTDLFAPGVDIYSLNTNNKLMENSGTSMASPVVAGVAALVLSYFPTLTAVQLKEILFESSIKPYNLDVNVPNKTKKVPFNGLSTTGGIVNAYKAIELASKRAK
jgi:subtilisin family serine protease